ncbi:MAG: oligosaccharide flippase family protein [Chloroflexota bacterium]
MYKAPARTGWFFAAWDPRFDIQKIPMLRSNIIANFLGKVWPSLLGILLVPVYLYYLGVEAYGLIGFFVSLQALISFLDLGLSTATNREVAIGLNSREKEEQTRDLVRTLEVVYGFIALLIALVFFFGSDWLATEWINVSELSVEMVRFAAIIFGISLALRWPVALYSGILQGSERQVLYNGLYVAIYTARGVGAAIVVALVSRNILAFLLWQLVTALLELLVMALAAWRTLQPGSSRAPRVDFSSLRHVWKFSASVGANSLLAALIKQMDRILISKLLLLQQVGYYTTANTVYSAVSLVTSPFASAAFPRFTALIAEKKYSDLADTYHKISQYVSFVVAPICAVLFFFSYDILLLWTRSEEVAVNAAPTLSILAVAALFNSMMQLPFMLQLAAGITWISLWNNFINLIVLAPIMYFLISRYGVAGAGISWALFNLLYFLVVPHVMHRHVLPNEKVSWFLKDTLFLIFLGTLPFVVIHMVGYKSLAMLFFEIMLSGIFYLVIVLLFYPAIRMAVKDLILSNPITRILSRRRNVLG